MRQPPETKGNEHSKNIGRVLMNVGYLLGQMGWYSIPMLRGGWCYIHAMDGSTRIATKMNHYSISNGSNQWQLYEAIHRLSIFKPSKAYQNASTNAPSQSARQTGVRTKAQAMEGGLGEREE